MGYYVTGGVGDLMDDGPSGGGGTVDQSDASDPGSNPANDMSDPNTAKGTDVSTDGGGGLTWDDIVKGVDKYGKPILGAAAAVYNAGKGAPPPGGGAPGGALPAAAPPPPAAPPPMRFRTDVFRHPVVRKPPAAPMSTAMKAGIGVGAAAVLAFLLL